MREFYIAGVQFHNSDNVKDQMKEGDELIMRPEPDNKYDPNAVALLWNNNGTEDDTMIGYVPAKFSGEISADLLTSDNVKCILTQVNVSAKTWERFKVLIGEVEDDFESEDNLRMEEY